MKSTNRDHQKEETRRLLLVAAQAAFTRTGLRATPVSEVARRAGRAHGSVFVHFGTQDGLIAAVVEDFGLRLAGQLHQRVEAGAGARQVLEAHLRGIEAEEEFYTRLVIEAPLLPPEARLSLVAIQSAVAFHLTPALLAAAGPRAPTPAFLFNTWVGLVHHYLVNRDLFAPGTSVLAVRGPELIDQFLALIDHPPGGS